jgi:hypothetical protein
MKRFAAGILALTLLSGCGAGTLSPAPVVKQGASARAKASPEVLKQYVVTGISQIFNTYDRSPRDGRVAFAEFKFVVAKDWFEAHDVDGDGFMVLDEWLTPDEIAYQVKSIVGAGANLVTQADRDQDRQLSLDEYLAYDVFTVEPTPWLNGAPDADVKANRFKRHAGPEARLNADEAASMIGDLLAQGYYLDDEARHALPRFVPVVRR